MIKIKNSMTILCVLLFVSCLKPPQMQMGPPKVFAPIYYIFNSDANNAGIRIMKNNPDVILLGDQNKRFTVDIRTGKCESISIRTINSLKICLPCQIMLGDKAHSHVGEQWKIVEEGTFTTKTRRFGEGQNLVMPTGVRKVKIEFFTGNLCIYAHNKLLFKQQFKNWDTNFIIYYFPSIGIIYFDPDGTNHDEGHNRNIVVIKTLPFDGFSDCNE